MVSYLKKNPIPVLILFGGVTAVASILAFSNFSAAGQDIPVTSVQWTQQIGAGIAIPACSASSASVTCVGSSPQVTINWAYGGQHGACGWADVSVSGGPSWNNQLCNNSVIWSGAANNTSYSYTVTFWVTIDPPPECTGWDKWGCTGVVDPPPYNAQIDSSTAPGSTNNSPFTTPNCAPPIADIKANSSDGPISIWWNTAATISWSSTNATSCSVSPTGWTGTSGSQSTNNLTSSQTYTLTCSGPGGSSSPDSVTVNVGGPPTANIQANGSEGPISISYNTAATISWTSANTTSCTVSPTGWTGISGSQSTGNLTSSQTYSLNCSAPGGPASDSVVVNVSPNQTPIAVATISKDGSNYADSITVTRNVETTIYLSAAGSDDPDNWTHPTQGVSSGGGKCEWNSDLNQGAPTFETTITNPSSPTACNISIGNLTFNDTPGTYIYQVLRITDKVGAVSSVDTVSITVTAGTAPSASIGPAHSLIVGSAHAHSGASATDPDSNLLSYNWSLTSCPGACPSLSGASGSLSGGSASIPSPTYTSNAAGNYVLQLTVTDTASLSDTKTLTETASVPNSAPSANIGPAHSLTVNVAHNHDGASATDPDNNLSSYAWALTSCPGACPSITANQSGALPPAGGSVPSPTYTPGAAGGYVLRLTVSDSGGLSDQRSITETAVAAPQCNDGSDNDGDGLNNYPADPGCSSATDDDERNACTDGDDNDNDNKYDYIDSPYRAGRPADPGCSSLQDNSELDPPTFCEIPPDDPNATCP